MLGVDAREETDREGAAEMSEDRMRAEFERIALCAPEVEPIEFNRFKEAWQAATASKQREIAELSSQVEVMREALEKIAKPEKLQSHGDPVVLRICALDALRITPSAALLAHDNEVVAKALEDVIDKFAFFTSEEGLWLADAIQVIADERRNRK